MTSSLKAAKENTKGLPVAGRRSRGEDKSRSDNKGNKDRKVKLEVVIRQWVDSRLPKSEILSDFSGGQKIEDSNKWL